MGFWPQSITAKPPPDLEEVRSRYAALFSRFAPAPEGVDFTPGQLGPIGGEWVGTPGDAPARTVLYFHGGGFVAGSPRREQVAAELSFSQRNRVKSCRGAS